MRIKSVAVFVLIVSCYEGANGQFSVNEYLSQSASAPEIRAIRAQQDFLGVGKFTSPFLREVEFRVRSRDFDGFQPDDYRLRVAPLNPYERKANKNHAGFLQEQINTQRLVEFSEVLSRRYNLLIKYYYLDKMRTIEKQESERYEQLIKANSRRIDAGKELIQLDKRLLFNELQRDDILSDLRETEYLIRSGYWFDGAIALENFNLVSVDRISTDLSMADQLGTINMYVLNEQIKAKISESELEINRQESFSNIGYLQAEYRSYRGETFKENFGLQLAFQLPVVNPDRPDLARRELDVIEDQQDVQQVEQEVNDRLFTLENSLQTLISQYRTVTVKQDSFDRLRSAGFSDVEGFLELEDYYNSLTRKRLELHRDILGLYIQWLQFKGLLAKEPLINYLSESRDSFGDE